MQDTIAQLTGVKAEVVLIHLNHTNPLLSTHSPERAEAMACGFTVSWGCCSPDPQLSCVDFLPGLVYVALSLPLYELFFPPLAMLCRQVSLGDTKQHESNSGGWIPVLSSSRLTMLRVLTGVRMVPP